MAPLAARAQRNAPELSAPISVYIDGPNSTARAATSTLSEALALRDINQLARLKESGLRVDYDLLDAYAVAPDGLHPFERSAAWPDGPDAWIARCRAVGIRPGLRFSNSALRPDGRATVLYDAEILHVFIPALQFWYDRGIRLFAFEGLDLTAGTPETPAGLTQNEIVARNREAFRDALTAFRTKNRGVVLLAIEIPAADLDASTNSPFGSDPSMSNPNLHNEASHPGAFLLLSAGPPHTSTTPQSSLQRAIDIETDGQIRHHEQLGVSLAHIFSCGFIAAPADAVGPDADSLPRGPLRGWKGAFLLSMARGGWVNALSGSFDSIPTADVHWMARVQKLFFLMQAQGQMHSFGGPPPDGSNMASQPYGFAGATRHGAVYVVVNPGQTVATLPFPALVGDHASGPGRVLFRDAGFSPRLTGNAITLGPGQMAAVGSGAYAAPGFNFGVQQDVVIPSSIEPVDADFQLTAPGLLEARIDPPIRGVLRVVVIEREAKGGTQPGTANSAPAGSNNRFTLEITQAGRPIPLRTGGIESEDNGALNAQSSWAVAEIDINDLTPGIPLRVRFHSNENLQPTLEGSAYQIIY
ncbi:MAG: hypothetical protein WAL45_20410 [Terracidiphilus sp.]